MYKMIAALSFAAFVAGCSKSIPDCSDDEATDLVKQVINDNLVEKYGKDAVKNATLKILFIKTTDTDKKSGAKKCSATLNVSDSNHSAESPITYNIDKEDDNITVAVWGIDDL